MNLATRPRRQVNPGLANSAGGLAIQCPRCSAFVAEISAFRGNEGEQLVCTSCLFQIKRTDGIWNALSPDREEHFSSFITDYEKIRAAEGRGSRNSEYYLSLPGRDISGRNQSQWMIRSHTFDCLESSVLPGIEERSPSSLTVLDLGAGNCWLSYRLALRGHLPAAVDLLVNPFDGMGAAQHYQARVPALFPRFRAELDQLPFADRQFDVAIFNASFHYSEDFVRTLAETVRCLRRPGWIVIADSPWYRHERSGEQMLAERRAAFTAKHGIASDSLASLEFLTDDRLGQLESRFAFRWRIHEPHYGLRWQLRPVLAKLQGRREPSRFRIYVAEVSQ